MKLIKHILSSCCLEILLILIPSLSRINLDLHQIEITYQLLYSSCGGGESLCRTTEGKLFLHNLLLQRPHRSAHELPVLSSLGRSNGPQRRQKTLRNLQPLQRGNDGNRRRICENIESSDSFCLKE